MESSSLPSLKNDDSKDTHANKYKEIIASLPREKSGWYTFNDIHMYKYQGFWYLESFLEGIMAAQEHFQAKSNDILVASYLKTGTTWLKALTFAIATRSAYDDSTSPLLTKLPHECIPFLEIDLAKDSSNRDIEVPFVATHIPYNSLPKSVVDSGCKIVYIWRDPKDVFVSKWHFVAAIQKSWSAIEPFPLEEAFELFCQGICCYGPYWDHVLGYWQANLESPGKVLFLKYEEMKKDTSLYVKKLAEFMGYPFSIEEDENGVVQKIISMCSFENLRNLEVNKSGKHRQNTGLAVNNNAYFRKAKIGDWQNELTAEMGARLDSIMEQKFRGSGLTLMSLPHPDAQVINLQGAQI